MSMMTSSVRDELSKVTVNHTGCRRAQLATVLRMAAELRVCGGLVVAAEVPTEAMARWLRREIAELHGIEAVARVPASRAIRYSVRVQSGGVLARAAGMIDHTGRPVAGLPTQVVGGSLGEVAAAWRGAFMASGTLANPGRRPALELRCPTPETAYALASCARRLGVVPLVRESRGVDRILIRERNDIALLLARMEAPASLIAWERRRARHIPDLAQANVYRTATAAAQTCARVERALAVLGDAAPEHLADTGALRVLHSESSLEELGRLSTPPLTKDTVAGRLRRLLTMADKYAAAQLATQSGAGGAGAASDLGPTASELATAGASVRWI